MMSVQRERPLRPPSLIVVRERRMLRARANRERMLRGQPDTFTRLYRQRLRRLGWDFDRLN